MSNVPQPPFGPPAGAPVPQQPAWAGQAPAPPRNGATTAKIVAAIVVAAGLGGTGVFLATRGGDKAPATVATDDTSPDTTESPGTTEAPPTTVPRPTTTIHALNTVPFHPPTTTAFTIPAGAVDLGHQVYIQLPDGWTDSKDSASGVDTITDGTAKVALQVLVRTPGENPQALLQEYIDTFSGDFDAVGLAPSRSFNVAGSIPTVEYGVYYRTWDAAGGASLLGGAYVFQRGDGLSAVYDVFSESATMGVPADQFATFQNSFSSAPPIGDVVPLDQYPMFRVNGLQQPIEVDGMLAFTPTPGFTEISAGSGYGLARQGGEDFSVARLPAQASLDAALEQAKASLNTDNTGVTFGDLVPNSDLGTLTREGVGWNGTYSDGNPVTGGIDVYFDPATGNAVAVIRNWYTTDDGVEPYEAEVDFMFATLSDTLETIGIP